MEVCKWCGRREQGKKGLDDAPGMAFCRSCREHHPAVSAMFPLKRSYGGLFNENPEPQSEYVDFLMRNYVTHFLD